MSRVESFLRHVPLGVMSLMAVNVAVYLYSVLLAGPFFTYDYSFIVRRIIFRQEFYRAISSAFVHLGLFHFLMNMMALVMIGEPLERAFGTVRFLFAVLAILLASAVLFLAIAFSLSVMTSDYWIDGTACAGFSGVIFGFLVIECFCSREETRDFCGVRVSTRVYPLLMLVLMQVIMPNVSFLGHLCGMLGGFCVVEGCAFCLIPSVACMHSLESGSMNCERRLPGYIACPTFDNLVDDRQSSRDILRGVRDGTVTLVRTARQCCCCLASQAGLTGEAAVPAGGGVGAGRTLGAAPVAAPAVTKGTYAALPGEEEPLTVSVASPPPSEPAKPFPGVGRK